LQPINAPSVAPVPDAELSSLLAFASEPHETPRARPATRESTAALETTLAALRDIRRPLYAVAVNDGRVVVLTDRAPRTLDGLTGVIPAVSIEDLGSLSFRKEHNLRLAYVAGAMAGGIASVDLVVDMAQAGCLGFFGAGALPLPVIEKAIREIEARLPGGESFGVNLLHNYYDEKLEWATVELFMSLHVTRVEAAAFVAMSAPLVYYRVKGIHRGSDGRIVVPHHVFAKVSRPEVATQFLAPPPEQLLAELQAAGKITPDEAALAKLIPMANDLTCEADSGGHTDRRPLSVLLPMMLHEREQAVLRLRLRPAWHRDSLGRRRRHRRAAFGARGLGHGRRLHRHRIHQPGLPPIGHGAARARDAGRGVHGRRGHVPGL
jgi:hypothetical protein